jgi:hypothetical protein
VSELPGADIGPAGLGIVMLAIVLVGGGMVFFALFNRRRRDGSREDELATAPASDLPVARAPLAPATPDGEANVPRWLRASVREARFWTPPREPAPHAARRHTLRLQEPVGESTTRLVVRYEHVDILDQPNEAYAHRLAGVGTGDEVEIVELADAWALIRTPDGVTGWLPTMTVGAAPVAPEPSEAPPAAEEAGRSAARRTTRRRRSAPS